MIDCEHQWNWDKEIRFCLKCRQVRIFPTNGENGKIVWQGLDDKRNPLELSAEEKSILAHLAQILGVKKAADCIKIDMKLLRAWCGSYCRGQRIEPQGPQKPKRPYHRREKVDLKLDQPAELNKEVEIAEPVKLSPTSPKSALSIEVNKSNLLPSFPPFNDNWEASVQSEWLATYLELVKYGAMT